jgi:hypothetical protein
MSSNQKLLLRLSVDLRETVACLKLQQTASEALLIRVTFADGEHDPADAERVRRAHFE